jgi:hypothetical protein
MGAIFNKIPVDKIDDLGRITPDRADWLTSYADASGLSVVEVERLWYRFRQITGSNNKTKFYPSNTALPDELSTDSFVTNVSLKKSSFVHYQYRIEKVFREGAQCENIHF